MYSAPENFSLSKTMSSKISVLVWLFFVQVSAKNTTENNYLRKDTTCSLSSRRIPWMVVIFGSSSKKPDMFYKCVGTLINERYVLTAASCIIPTEGERSFDSLVVRLGRLDRGVTCNSTFFPFRENDCAYFFVKEAIPHPRYDERIGLHNIGMLRLHRTIPITNHIYPTKMSGSSVAEPQSTLAIFGATCEFEATPVTLISNEDCKRMLSETNSSYLANEYNMCTIDRTSSTEITAFIHGAPIMIFHQGRWHLEGIVKPNAATSQGLLTIHTKVYKYFEWIQKNMRTWYPFRFLGNAYTTSELSEENCEASFRLLPWLVGVLVENSHFTAAYYKCLGTLINARYVLTAAQCLEQVPGEPFFDQIFIRFGRLSGSARCVEWQTNENDCLYLYVEESITHPLYDNHTGTHDIALLRLRVTVPYTPYIHPVSVNMGILQPGDVLHIFGIAKTCFLDKTLTTVQPNEKCYQISKEAGFSSFVDEYDLCTTNTNITTKTTRYVSGAPVMVFKNKKWQIVGMTKFRSNSTGNIPVILTKLGNYSNWIDENLRSYLPVGYQESCTTLKDEQGKCTHLSFCQSLLAVFVNPSKKAPNYLKKIICSRDDAFKYFDREYEIDYDFIVCCSLSETVSDYTDLIADSSSLTKLLDKRYCGYRHKNVSTNEEISVDELPWIAQIFEVNKDTPSCIGTLINARYVLTTAYNAKRSISFVRLGEFHRENVADCVDPAFAQHCISFEDYGVKEQIPHPFYKFSTKLNDIGLVRLNRAVEYSDYIRPICLPTPGARFPGLEDTLYGSGWVFSVQSSAASKTKKQIETKLIAGRPCRKTKAWYSENWGINDQYKFCTVDSPNNTDFFCEFDEGAPVMFVHKNQWHIEGIYTPNFQCNPKVPRIHTRVSKYLPWIADNMKP